MRGKATPRAQDEVLYRSEDLLQLFTNKVINSTTPQYSDPVACAAFRHFSLFLYLDSTSTPTTIHIEVEFLDPWTSKWHTYKQGPFASLYYEDGDTASGIWECFTGFCLGRQMRVKLTGAGTTGAAYFTVSAGVDLWN